MRGKTIDDRKQSSASNIDGGLIPKLLNLVATDCFVHDQVAHVAHASDYMKNCASRDQLVR